MPIRVLHLSSFGEICGIGKYQRMFVDAMRAREEVHNEFFQESPTRLREMSPPERRGMFDRLRDALDAFDVLHVQHEFSFFPDLTFAQVCRTAKQAGGKLVVTVHTSPAAVYDFSAPKPRGYGPRPIASYLKGQVRLWASRRSFVAALRTADRIVVHNDATQTELTRLGVPADRIRQFVVPVPLPDGSSLETHAPLGLRREPDDVVVALVGFLSEAKGVDDAIEALTFLPERYNLAIIGGDHPRGTPYVQKAIRTIARLGLADRVRITGYVEEDARLNAWVRECDLCVYPYDRRYYGHASSAALNDAFANHKPVVAYPTAPFLQIARLVEGAIEFAEEPRPEALARAIRRLDLRRSAEASKAFSEAFSYPVVAEELLRLYLSLCDSSHPGGETGCHG